MKITDELINYIESNSEITISDVDTFFSEGTPRFMIKSTPSEAEEVRYMDGKRSGVYSFDLYAKDTNSKTATDLLFIAEKLLDLPNGVYLDNEIEFLKCKVVKTATLIDSTTKDEKIYSSSFSLDYYI